MENNGQVIPVLTVSEKFEIRDAHFRVLLAREEVRQAEAKVQEKNNDLNKVLQEVLSKYSSPDLVFDMNTLEFKQK